jgi:hypothetical protein
MRSGRPALGALTQGPVVDKVLKADGRELVMEFADGTRLLVRQPTISTSPLPDTHA